MASQAEQSQKAGPTRRWAKASRAPDGASQGTTGMTLAVPALTSPPPKASSAAAPSGHATAPPQAPPPVDTVSSCSSLPEQVLLADVASQGLPDQVEGQQTRPPPPQKAPPPLPAELVQDLSDREEVQQAKAPPLQKAPPPLPTDASDDQGGAEGSVGPLGEQDMEEAPNVKPPPPTKGQAQQPSMSANTPAQVQVNAEGLSIKPPPPGHEHAPQARTSSALPIKQAPPDAPEALAHPLPPAPLTPEQAALAAAQTLDRRKQEALADFDLKHDLYRVAMAKLRESVQQMEVARRTHAEAVREASDAQAVMLIARQCCTEAQIAYDEAMLGLP